MVWIYLGCKLIKFWDTAETRRFINWEEVILMSFSNGTTMRQNV